MKKKPNKRHGRIVLQRRQRTVFRRHPLAASLLQLFAAGLFVVSPFVYGAGASRGTTPPVNALPVPSSSSSPTPRSFVYAGAATVATDGNSNMVVTTTSRNTGLNWDSFNIGANASVYFGQPDAASRVLNRIWQNDPSVIMGRLGSNGQIYLINQNGILFGDGAQVNVGGLVASALGVSEDLLNKGLPGVRGESLKFAWEGNGADFAADKGYVVVDPGARITTPAGGRVVLLGAKTAQNAGTVQIAGGGEAIVAAGGSVLLTAPTDPNLRGLLVEVKPFKGTDAGGVPVTLGGTATNASGGTLDTGRDGVVTLAALAVNQQGTVKAGKALNINGETLLVSGANTTPKVVVTPTANKMAITWTSAHDMNNVDRALLPEGQQTVEILQPAGNLQIDWLGGFLGQGVAAGQTLLFTQPDSGAVAYNFVNDAGRKDAAGNLLPWSGGRTTIDGNLTANGQVYLINTQGIRFASTARVRTGYFVASALGMNPLIVDKGINTALNGYLPIGGSSSDYLASQAFYLSPTAFADDAAARAAFSAATVAVDRGASIAAASGSVLLIGSSIRQSGSIRTESGGQVLLAAGAGVFLKPAYYSGLRGFTAAVNPLVRDPVTTTSLAIIANTLEHGAIHNDGDIRADFGDISLTGFAITQAGSLVAATSVGRNGAIHLDARDTVETVRRHLDAQGAVLPYAYEETSEDQQQSSQYGTTYFSSPKVGGTLTFTPGSVTQVALNGDDGKTTTPDQPFFKSTIDALAKNISVQGGALLEARGGTINLAAYDTFDAANLFAYDPYIPGSASSLGTLFIDHGAKLDVSGAVADTKVAVDGQGNVLRDADGKAKRVRRTVADLFIPVELRGDQLANNPAQRNGVLKDKTAYVDIRDGVAIADLSAYFQIGQTVEERAASGGSINLAGRSVIVKDGATLDVSGGRIDYAAGAVQESRATTRGGVSYRLNDAPTKLAYRGLITATRQEAAYSEGRSAGTVSLSGDHLVLGSNDLLGATSPGPRQRKLGDPLTDRYALPRGAQLVVKDYQAANLYDAAQGASQAAAQAALDQAALSRQVAFINGRSTLADGLNAGDVAGGLLELSSSLVDHGFSRFDIASAGRVELPAGVGLALAPGGSFKLGGRQVYVAGDVSAPGGAIDLGTYDLFGPTIPSSQKTQGNYSGKGGPYSLPLYPYYTLVVDRGATLSTAGRWINDALARSNDNLPALALNGGSIKLASLYDLDLRAGSLVDVSGGGQLQRDGKLVNGNGGSLLLAAGDAEKDSYFYFGIIEPRDASLFLDGTLAAYALGKGGSLEVKTSFVTLGTAFGQDSRAWTRNQRLGLADKPKQVGAAFSADFLNQGGFYSFSFVGRDGVTVLDDTRLVPTPRNWIFAANAQAVSRGGLNGDYRSRPSASVLASFVEQKVLPPALRGGSTALSLATRSTSNGDLTVGRGAYLGVDPLGSIKLESYRQLTVLGTLEAPAGLIDLSLTASPDDGSVQTGGKYTGRTSLNLSESIYLGAESRLLAGGATRLDASTQTLLERGQGADSLLARGLYRGQVLAGGTVNLNAGLFYLVSRAGSLIDVGGSADTLSTLSDGRYLAQTQGGAGGDLSLAASSGMFLDGAYRGAGGNGALGGNFSLRLNPGSSWGAPSPFNDVTKSYVRERQLTLYQSSAAHASLWDGLGLNEGSYLAHGAVIDTLANNGKAALDLSLLAQGGFGSWYLSSAHAMTFAGAINTGVGSQLRLDAISFNAADNAAAVALRAASFQFGNYNGSKLLRFSSPTDTSGTETRGQEVAAATTPSTGTASFTLAGADIGLTGSFLMNGFGSTRFLSDGDIHFDSKYVPSSTSSSILINSGLLKSTGTLEFSAARLAPGTFSDFTVDLSSDAASHIGISRRGSAGSLLSAAGRLEFRAADILHQGTVVAPLGQVVFTGCYAAGGCNAASPANGAVTLGEQSVTSVAADANSQFLLGYTIQGGRVWNYDSYGYGNNGSQYAELLQRAITQLPDKAVVVNADRSQVKTGARIDLSGGGDGIAWEFSPGATGKTDILQPSATAEPTVFAIIPGLQGAFAATTADSQSMLYYSVSNPVTTVDSDGIATTNYSVVPSLKAGDQIVLGKNTTGLVGSYTLLPARYALLPGAYLVTVKSTQGNLLQAQVQTDGAVLVSGTKVATTTGGGVAYASPMTVELASQSVIQERAKYDIATATELADRLFAGKDKNFAGDAGRLSVTGRSLLGYDPTVSATHVDAIVTGSGTQRAGRGGKVDLAAPNLFVGDGGSAAPDASWVSLDKDVLNRQGIASLLLGGTRAGNGNGETITVVSDHLQVATTGSSALRGPELLFAAKSTLDVAAGSKLEATEEIAPRNYTIDGDGAFLRVAGGGQSGLSRTGVTRSDGNLTVAAGASIAGRSLIFNATLSNTLAAAVALHNAGQSGSRGGSIDIGASRINVVGSGGNGTAPGDGLTLSNATLAPFVDADQIRLTSYSTIDLYGNALLGGAGLKSLVLGAAGIAGHGAAGETATLQGNGISFENQNPASASFTPGAALGGGQLAINAQTVTFDGNASQAMRDADNPGFALRGFAGVTVNAAEEVRFKGLGLTAVDNAAAYAYAGAVAGSPAALTFNTGRVVAMTASDQAIRASGAVGVRGGSTAAPAAELGGRLEMRGQALAVTGRIDTTAGRLLLKATDNVTIGGQLLAEGFRKAFTDTYAYAPAGEISLESANGDVIVNPGAVVSVSAAESGDAGALGLSAKQGTVSAAAGTLRGTAADGSQGRLTADAAHVSLDGLAGAVREGNTTHFQGKWDIRARNDNLRLTDSIKAAAVTLAADRGDIDIYGTIDASGTKGGLIQLYANRAGSGSGGVGGVGGNIFLRAGSKLLAYASQSISDPNQGTAGQGGTIILGVSGSSSDDEAGTSIHAEPSGGGKAAALIDASTPTGSSAAAGQVIFSLPRSDSETPTVTGAVILGTYASNMSLSPLKGVSAAAIPLLGVAFSSTSGAFVLTVTGNGFGTLPDFSAYQSGMVVVLTTTSPSGTSGAVTVNVNGKGAVPVVRADGSAFDGTNKLLTNQPLVAVYDGSTGNPTSGKFVVSYIGMAGGGTGAAYTATPGGLSNTRGGDVASLAQLNGQTVAFKAGAANTGAATLNVNGLGAKKLLDEYGNPLTSGAIANNDLVIARYDASLDGGAGAFKLVKDSTSTVLAPSLVTPPSAQAALSGTKTLISASAGLYSLTPLNTVAFTLTTNGGLGNPGSYQNGMTVVLATNNAAGLGGAATVNVNGLGAKPVVNADGSDFNAASKLLLKGQPVVAVYDSALGKFKVAYVGMADTSTTAGAYVVSGAGMSNTPANLTPVNGTVVVFRAGSTNTGTAPTLNVNGKGVKTLKNPDGSALAVGAITAGDVVVAQYNGTEFRIIKDTAGIKTALVAPSITALPTPATTIKPITISAAALTVTNANVSAYQNGMVVVLTSSLAANITSPMTVTINSLGAKPVKLRLADGSYVDFSATNPLSQNQPVVAVYDAANARFVVSYVGMVATNVINAYSLAPMGLSNTRSSDLLSTGMTVVFRASAANTGAATLNVNGLGLKSLTDEYGNLLQANAIAAGDVVVARYDGTRFKLVKDDGVLAGLGFSSVTINNSTLAGTLDVQGSIVAAARADHPVTATLVAERTVRQAGDIVIGHDDAVRNLAAYNTMAKPGAVALAGLSTLAAAQGLALQSGLRVVSGGDITVNEDWDLAGGAVPGGMLTLQAANNLNLLGTLSDGFTSNGTNSATSRNAKLGTSSSLTWSYRLAAGADTAAANPLAVNAAAATTGGKLTVGADRFLRTGRGRIALAAAGDIDLRNGAAVYTAGYNDTANPIHFSDTQTDVFRVLASGGGNLSVSAGGSITEASQNFGSNNTYTTSTSAWLVPFSQGFTAGGDNTTQWYPRIASFLSGFATFGGGDMELAAGKNIQNVQAVLPTSGKMAGSGNALDPRAPMALSKISGGGDLTVRAGGDIAGGNYYVEQGALRMSAGGGMPAGVSSPMLVAVGGNGVARLAAMQDVVIKGNGNPLMTPASPVTITWDGKGGYVSSVATSFLVSPRVLGSNTDVAALEVVAVNGAITLSGTAPSQVKAATLNADKGIGITTNLGLSLLPGRQGQVDLLSAAGISFGGPLTQYDTRDDLVPGMQNPLTKTYWNSTLLNEIHNSVAWHADDAQPSRIIALNGNISSTAPSTPRLTFNEAVQVQASGDIGSKDKSVAFSAQHWRGSDISTIEAGGSIVFAVPPSVLSDTGDGFKVIGPGLLAVAAGKNVDLGGGTAVGTGSSYKPDQGIVTSGNLENPYLPAGGASVSVLAGASRYDYAGFAAFAADKSGYADALAAFVDQHPDYRNGASNAANNKAALLAMPDSLKATFLRGQFFALLRAYGLEMEALKTVVKGLAANQGEDQIVAGLNESYRGKVDAQAMVALAKQGATPADSEAKAQAAIAALFPADAVQGGDIVMFKSQIKTKQGGDIDLLAPGGDVVVGVANPGVTKMDNTQLPKRASELGLITVRGGDIRVYTRGNFQVNKSRVFTLGGGDIQVWAGEGDIDAGSGAKTTQSTPPPVLTYVDGQPTLDVSNSISGAGIATLKGADGSSAGSLYLTAPKGFIDAGEAGLRSTGNVFLSAVKVLNAANIQAAGTVAGAPPPAAPPPPATGESASSAATKSDTGALVDPAANRSPRGVLTVEVMGDGAPTVPAGGRGSETAPPKPGGETDERKQQE